MDHQNHFERVRGLVGGHSGVPRAEIGMETRLVEDLGIDGDTGREFFVAFADEFGVDLSRMDPCNYFDDAPPLYWFSEVIPVAASLAPAFRRHVLRATRGRRAVTVRDLIASAHAGRWIRPGHRRTDLDPLRLTWKSLLMLGLATPLLALVATMALGLFTGWSPRTPSGAAVFCAIILALLGAKLLMAWRWLGRLDAAAAFEERALSEEG